MLMNVAGYLLAIGIAYSGASGARLNNTGELASKPPYNMRSTLITLLMLCSCVTGFAAVLYFSWSFLHWQHIVAFLAVGVLGTGFVARTNSRQIVWGTFMLSEVVVVGAEGMMLFL